MASDECYLGLSCGKRELGRQLPVSCLAKRSICCQTSAKCPAGVWLQAHIFPFSREKTINNRSE